MTTHLCRGNFRSSWAAEGGYDFVAEALLNELDVDGFFMEWDDERSGGFEPLRFLPKGDKQVVLGLVTTKRGELETKDELKRRIEEAATLCAARPALPLAAVRIRLDARGQRPHRGRAVGEAAPRRRGGAGGLGVGVVGPGATRKRWEYPDSLDAMVAAPESPPRPARERRRAGARDDDPPGGDRPAPHASLAERPLRHRDRPPRASRRRRAAFSATRG